MITLRDHTFLILAPYLPIIKASETLNLIAMHKMQMTGMHIDDSVQKLAATLPLSSANSLACNPVGFITNVDQAPIWCKMLCTKHQKYKIFRFLLALMCGAKNTSGKNMENSPAGLQLPLVSSRAGAEGGLGWAKL